MSKSFLPVLLAATIATIAQSQNYAPPIHLSAKDGLAHRWVNDIFQDSRGFLWFSTVEGLNRYDGHDFTLFKPSESDGGGGAESDWIRRAVEDKGGNLRVSGNHGLYLFDMRTKRFSLHPHQSWNSATHPSYNCDPVF